MANTFNGDFARMIPRNHLAQMLFSETYMFVEKYNTFHLQLVGRTGSGPSGECPAVVEESTDYDTGPDEENKNPNSRTIQHAGHFILSFDETRHPEIPHLGWRVGKGSSKSPANRGVDLLLSRPGDFLSRSLASIHMLFRFNLKSGFLMLVGGSSKVDIEFNVGGEWEKLGRTEQRLMHQSRTMLRAGVCEYDLEYTISEEHRESYFWQRNFFLEKLSSGTGYIRPPKPLQYLPGDPCVQRGRYLEFETQGRGTFGWVTQGVDTTTGDRIAIKELRIDGRRSRVAAMEEVDFGIRFLNHRGLLPNLDAWCEHGQPDSCSNMEKFHIFMPQAVSAFSSDFWRSPYIPRTNKLQWLREILEGIQALHAMGIMHRDIRLQNMLIMSTDPGRACLCDYGKAVQATSDTVTTIGPIHTLAPEVWLISSKGPYSEKIDTWAYGYAIAELLGYSVRKYPGRPSSTTTSSRDHNPRINRDRHAALLKMLEDRRTNAPEDGALVDLVLNLLAWRPTDRWSATHALSHECWAPVMEAEQTLGQKDTTHAMAEKEEAPESSKRAHSKNEVDDGDDRHKHNDDDKNNKSDDIYKINNVDEVPTQEFSQRTKEYIRQKYNIGS